MRIRPAVPASSKTPKSPNLDVLEGICRANGWRMGITLLHPGREEFGLGQCPFKLIVREPTGAPGERAMIIECSIYAGLPEEIDESAAVLLDFMRRDGMIA